MVVQRVAEASVTTADGVAGSIGAGLLVLIGIETGDAETDADFLARKCLGLRIFSDEGGKMNRNVREAGGSLLVVSQFTLSADCRRGMRPSFDGAAPPAEARRLYEYFVTQIDVPDVKVETGVFQASMKVSLINDGPVTLICDSKQL